ncbi:hypothetical protein MKW98_030158 [Papaver atlanticum]|uniref:Transposase n=1 Tax=Papaver atlanticum TaxID=357466 RepID=A0AAD4XJG1_9MAGN|nr:hypothetical protein MKW98_030158 [Papaver atlanticum]
MLRDLSFWGIIRDQKQRDDLRKYDHFLFEGKQPHNYAFNSQDNDIENIHENFNDERLPVFFNEHGQWNGPAEFSTWIREITRSLIGLGYKNWKEVPQDYKEDIWNSVQAAKARSQVKAQYTGGRKGVPRRWLEMSPCLCSFVGSCSYRALSLPWLEMLFHFYMGAGVSKSQFLASEFMKARLQEEKHNVRKENQKNEALKAQLDAERQENNTGVHDQISNISCQQDIGVLAPPSSFGLCCLRNLRKKPVALAYVDTKLVIDDDHDCTLVEIIEPSAMLCDRDDVVLRDVPIGNLIRWPKAYATLVGERSS